MNAKTNAPVEALENARTAGKSWGKASHETAKGDAFGTHAGLALWNYEFNFTVDVGGDVTETHTTSLSKMHEPLFNEDGTTSAKAIGARFRSCCVNVFGIATPDQGQEAGVRRVLKNVRYIMALDAAKDTKLNGNRLVVPYRCIVKEPDAKASENKKQEYKDLRNSPRVLDGKKGTSLRELANRASEMFPANPRSATTDSKPSLEKSLAEAVKFLNERLTTLIDPNAKEADIALSNERRLEMFALANNLAAYFAADPIEEADAAVG